MTDRYILFGREPIPEPDVLTWARWFEGNTDRQIGRDETEHHWVSTVFLGLDHRDSDRNLGGPPVLFETMVFEKEWTECKDMLGLGDGRYQKSVEEFRYCTYDQAEEGHAAALAMVRALEEVEVPSADTPCKEDP